MVRPASADVADDRVTVALVAGGATVLATVWLAVWVALDLSGQEPPANPFNIAFELSRGDLTWSTSETVTAVVVAALVAALAVGTVLLVRRATGKPVSVDRAARHMATPRAVRRWTRKPISKKSRSFGLDGGKIGLPIGYHRPSGERIWSSWEDMLLLIAGPRTMKSSSFTIPLALAAPGALFVTENKRGVLDHTRGPRKEFGHVWVFDPQGVADEAPTWWWNPLTYVTDESKAEKLAQQIAESSREPGMSKDAYFEPEAVNLLHLMLLAAATAGEPITTVYTWLSRAEDATPVNTLSGAGYRLQAESLESLAGLNPKQRDGVYGGTRAMVGFLRNSRMMQWVTPPAHAGVDEFRPADYVRSTDTLYALSKDGKGSAGPLVGALTLAVFEAADEYATTSPGGRLPVPMVGLLDEAANVCRFKDLDSKYSHYGSRGIVLMTVLQSYAQGEEIWGKHGMDKLWSAANVRIYGGGVADTAFLQRISDLIGTYDHVTSSVSRGRGGGSRTRSVSERPILSVAELGALPPGRAVVLASQTPAMLIKVVPWFKQSKATRTSVTDSVQTYEPVATEAGRGL